MQTSGTKLFEISPHITNEEMFISNKICISFIVYDKEDGGVNEATLTRKLALESNYKIFITFLKVNY